MKQLLLALFAAAGFVGASAQTIGIENASRQPIENGATLTLSELNPDYLPYDIYEIEGRIYVTADDDAEIIFSMQPIEGEGMTMCTLAGNCFPSPITTQPLYVGPDEPCIWDLHSAQFYDPNEAFTQKAKFSAEGGDNNMSIIVVWTNQQAGVEKVTIENSLSCNGRAISWAGTKAGESLTIYDFEGREVYAAQVEANGTLTPALPKGAYIVRLGVNTLKFTLR